MPSISSKAEILHWLGDLSDHVILEIQTLAADPESLAEAASYLSAEDDVMADERISLSGVAGQIYSIVVRDRGEFDENYDR